jgi:acyl carrier protein
MDTFDTIRQIISETNVIDLDKIKLETTFEELDMDSLEVFELIFEAENKFNIKVPNTELAIKDVQGIVNLIDSLRN